ncbi:MAG: DUF4124 domain-containing protein [Steroidobacteraceae bacterium]
MRKIFVIAVVALLGSTAFAADEIYRWKDATGIWHYSDQPRPGAEVVHNNSRAPTASPATPAIPRPAAAVPAAPATANEPLPVSKEVAEQVRQEAATAKVEECAKAKATYDTYVRAQAMRRTDAKGNPVVMTSAEIDAARLQARAARDLACGP